MEKTHSFSSSNVLKRSMHIPYIIIFIGRTVRISILLFFSIFLKSRKVPFQIRIKDIKSEVCLNCIIVWIFVLRKLSLDFNNKTFSEMNLI